MPIVVKADGIAAGKGVIICKSSNQVLTIAEKSSKENLCSKTCSRRIFIR